MTIPQGSRWARVMLGLSILAVVTPSVARDGDIDVTFGTQGLLAPIDPDTGQPVDDILDLLPTGTATAGLVETRGQTGVVLFDVDGNIDASFGDVGLAAVPLDRGQLHLLPGGSILVIGQVGPVFSMIMRVARVTTTGALDPTFGTGGVAEADVGFNTFVRSFGVQPDGKIVLHLFDGDDEDVILLRFEADGDVDATFGAGGLILQAPVGGPLESTEMVMQADGKMVVGGIVPGIGVHEMRLARLDADGAVDATYGTGGTVTATADAFVRLARQPDGSILTVTTNDERDQSNVLRFSPAGVLDTSFGVGGVVESEMFRLTSGRVRVLSDGRFLMVGLPASFAGAGALERYDADGQLDLAFGPCAASILLTGTFGSPVELPDGRLLGFSDGKLVRVGTPDAMPACVGAKARGSAVRYVPVVNIFNGKFVWKWKSAAAVDKADFGDPIADAHYLMCAFQDGSGKRGAFRIEAHRGGVQCPPFAPTESCWKEQTRGFKLKRKQSSIELLTMKLLAGEAGRAKIVVKSKSDERAGEPPYDLPVRIRMVRMDGHECCQACWEAVFSEARTNVAGGGGSPAAGAFAAKSD